MLKNLDIKLNLFYTFLLSNKATNEFFFEYSFFGLLVISHRKKNFKSKKLLYLNYSPNILIKKRSWFCFKNVVHSLRTMIRQIIYSKHKSAQKSQIFVN